MRVYGYTYYSDWIENGPMMSLQPYAYYDSGDYEINNHTRGVSVSFTDQINPQNLLEAEGSYTTATGARIYNEQMFESATPTGMRSPCWSTRTTSQQRHVLRAHRSAKEPASTTPTTCSDGGGSGVVYGGRSDLRVALDGIYGRDRGRTVAGLRCGGGPCALLRGRKRRVRSEQHGDAGVCRLLDHRSVAPERPLNFNVGDSRRQLQLRRCEHQSRARRANFWFNAFNQDTCYDTQTLTLVDRSRPAGRQAWSTNSQKPCSAFGSQYVNANLQNVPTATSTTTSSSRASA